MRARARAADAPGIWEMDASDVQPVTDLLAELATADIDRVREILRDEEEGSQRQVIIDVCRRVLVRSNVSERRPGERGHGQRMTWADLVAAVRAQIDVSDEQAYQWCLERARVLNAEAGWLATEQAFTVALDGHRRVRDARRPRQHGSGDGGRLPYKRSTPSQMDFARSCGSPAPDLRGDLRAGRQRRARSEIWPPLSAGSEVALRYLADVVDDRALEPPFPSDLQSIIADGAIAIGLARMDERFDSAGYFDAKFADGIQRLKRRRHSHVGRGGTPIRLVT
jgi:hypothetical protein